MDGFCSKKKWWFSKSAIFGSPDIFSVHDSIYKTPSKLRRESWAIFSSTFLRFSSMFDSKIMAIQPTFLEISECWTEISAKLSDGQIIFPWLMGLGQRWSKSLGKMWHILVVREKKGGSWYWVPRQWLDFGDLLAKTWHKYPFITFGDWFIIHVYRYRYIYIVVSSILHYYSIHWWLHDHSVVDTIAA